MEKEVEETTQDFVKEIGVKERRKLQAQAKRDRGVWWGVSVFGLVGWSVVIPALVALAAGIWIDRHFPSRFSWTLMLLVAGIGLGCLNAWHWVKQESKELD